MEVALLRPKQFNVILRTLVLLGDSVTRTALVGGAAAVAVVDTVQTLLLFEVMMRLYDVVL